MPTLYKRSRRPSFANGPTACGWKEQVMGHRSEEKEYRVQPNNSSAWKDIYQSAILEVDYVKLIDRIADARAAIHDRAEEILMGPSGDEHRALNNALRTLRLLEEVALRQKPAA